MATTVTVSRRFVKMKNRPRRKKPTMSVERAEGAGESVVYASSLAAAPRPPARSLPWWRSPWAILGLFVFVLVGLGLALMFGGGKMLRYLDTRADERLAHGRVTGASRPGRIDESRITNAGARDGVTTDYDQRPPPDERSFLATPYARRGTATVAAASGPVTSLPDNVSGRCVVTGGGIEELQACLQRHGGR